jgi:hypothetical protein
LGFGTSELVLGPSRTAFFDEELSSGHHSKLSEAADRAERRCMKAATPGEKYAYVVNLVKEIAMEDRRKLRFSN